MEEHTLFNVELIDNFVLMTLEQMREVLIEEYPDISICKTHFYPHKRKVAVGSRLFGDEMNFEMTCVFIDEDGFNLYISRTRGWSKVDELVKTVVIKNRGTTVTVPSAVFSQDVIGNSLRKPVIVLRNKNRKANKKMVASTAKIGRRTIHFLSYLNAINVPDEYELKGNYIVMKNSPIHKTVVVREFIEERGYTCVYFPSYSPTEEFWSKAKYGVKRGPFDGSDTLTPRTVETCSQFRLVDCSGMNKALGFTNCCDSLEKIFRIFKIVATFSQLINQIF